MKKSFKQLLLLISLTLLLSLPYFVFAASPTPSNSQNTLGRLKNVAEKSYNVTAPEQSLMYSVSKIIQVFLSTLGVIFVVLMIYAGFKWMMAAGDADDVKKAKGTIRMAIIGLVITVSAYAIWGFVSSYLL